MKDQIKKLTDGDVQLEKALTFAYSIRDRNQDDIFDTVLDKFDVDAVYVLDLLDKLK